MPLAIIEFNDSTYNLYLGALILSGVLLLGLALTGYGATSGGARAISGLIGAGFFGYAIYLLFFNTSGEFYIFFYVFVVPILLLVQAVKNARAKKDAAQTPQA